MPNHYFYAVKLPTKTKQFLHQWTIENKGYFPFQRWVHSEDYHITLAFLGFAEAEQLNCSVQAVRQICHQFSSFYLTLQNIGTFGRPEAPRIFWADTAKSNELNDLQQQIYQKVSKCGFQLDPKPFKPHITLARKWNEVYPFPKEELPSFISDSHTFQVDEIVLYKTHMDKTPKYEIVELFPLN